MDDREPTHVTSILGDLADGRFAGRDVDPVSLTSADAAKRRLRLRSARGVDLAVDLPRGSYLRDGAVLLDDGERVVAIERRAEEAVVVRLAPDLAPAELLRQAEEMIGDGSAQAFHQGTDGVGLLHNPSRTQLQRAEAIQFRELTYPKHRLALRQNGSHVGEKLEGGFQATAVIRQNNVRTAFAQHAERLSKIPRGSNNLKLWTARQYARQTFQHYRLGLTREYTDSAQDVFVPSIVRSPCALAPCRVLGAVSCTSAENVQ